MKVTGVKTVAAQLRNLAERVPNGARQQFKRSAERIVEEAKLNVPVDDGLLEDSIRILRTTGTRGRMQIDIVVGDQTVINPDGRSIDLDQYAWIIHENYSQYMPGKKTVAKRLMNPDRHIGEGFLSRAVEDEQPKLERYTIRLIERIIRETMK